MSDHVAERPSNQRAPRFVRNPSGYHSHGKTHKEKVYNFGVHIKQFGWSGSWNEDEDSGILTAELKRSESERITIEWPENQWWPDVWYHYAGSTMKCRNISQAAKIASEKPNADRMRRNAGRGKNGLARRIAEAHASGAGNSDSEATDLIDSLRTTLPFDRESTTDEIRAVIKTKVNPTIVWINRLTGGAESDYIKTWSRHLKVTENREGKKIINFVGADRFRSVYVDSVIGFS